MRKTKILSLINLFRVLGIIFIVVMWILILFNPVIIMFYYGNPLYLFLYLLIVPEIFVGALVTGALFKILE